KDEGPADVRSNAEVGSIKERFEQGTAFKSDEPVKRRPEDEIEIKVAGKARQKFKEIDADGTMPIRPTMQSKPDAHISKWGKDKDAPVPEAINRRVRDDSDDQEEDEGAFEVKALMNKFKNIAKGPEETDTKPKPRKQFTPPPEGYKAEIESSGRERDPNVVSSSMKAELEGLGAIEAKELKARFEGKAAEDSATETVEEKRKRLEEEFKKYKQQKEIDSQNEPAAEEEAAAPVQKEEIQVAADHASKMAAKWEKIQKKEAKKAQKSQMPQKPAHSVRLFEIDGRDVEKRRAVCR
uniref:Uncharacterized protein n=1 Tax=Plectus sambesii TaxID=2011161 RepID=A0A914UXV2_9BILA